MSECSRCGRKIVAPVGPKTAPFLFVGEVPSRDDIVYGAAFAGDVGRILKSEMMRVGIPENQVRFITFWMHSELKVSDPTYKECFSESQERLLAEFSRRRGIMLFGAKLSQWAFDGLVSKYSGLEIPHDMLNPAWSVLVTGRLMVSISPGIALHQPVGDVRLSLQRFKEVMKP